MVIILYIAVDSVSLVLSDEKLTMHFNFDPISEPADMEFLYKYLGSDIDSKIKSTAYFHEFSQQFLEKEKMLPATFDVVRNQFFDLKNLENISSQKHLLSFYEMLILDLLLANIPVIYVYPGCSILKYTASNSDCTQSNTWSPPGYKSLKSFPQSPPIFNSSYHTIFRSILKGPEGNWLLEHIIPFTPKEIKQIKDIFSTYNDFYNTWTQAWLEYLKTVKQ